MQPSMKDKEIIFVVGLGRSGSSLLAGMLHKFGFNMGDRLIKADSGNPSGYYEDMELLGINEEILEESNATIRDITLTPKSTKRIEKRIDKWIANRLKYGKSGGKDPRVRLTLPLFMQRKPEVFKRVIYIQRERESSAKSLLKRDNVPLDISRKLWDTYTKRGVKDLKNLGLEVYEIQLEPFTKNLEKEFKKLVNWLGIKGDTQAAISHYKENNKQIIKDSKLVKGLRKVKVGILKKSWEKLPLDKRLKIKEALQRRK